MPELLEPAGAGEPRRWQLPHPRGEDPWQSQRGELGGCWGGPVGFEVCQQQAWPKTEFCKAWQVTLGCGKLLLEHWNLGLGDAGSAALKCGWEQPCKGVFMACHKTRPGSFQHVGTARVKPSCGISSLGSTADPQSAARCPAGAALLAGLCGWSQPSPDRPLRKPGAASPHQSKLKVSCCSRWKLCCSSAGLPAATGVLLGRWGPRAGFAPWQVTVGSSTAGR